MIHISEKEFKLLSDFIHVNYGIHMKEEKQTLLMGRLNKVLYELEFDNFTDYYKYLVADHTGKAVEVLIDKITTNHTFFMRESDHFMFFKDHVLPYLKVTVKNKDLRVWCAASSTGEEPYTLAMLISDFFDTEYSQWDTKLLATDLSPAALEVAKRGEYSVNRIAELPQHWKTKYFESVDKHTMVVKNQIRDEVIYRQLNLVDPCFPFKKKFHVIFCRNVMIYFDSQTKDELVRKMYDLLEHGGYLFVGHSESINRDISAFKYIRPAVYQKL